MMENYICAAVYLMIFILDSRDDLVGHTDGFLVLVIDSTAGGRFIDWIRSTLEVSVDYYGAVLLASHIFEFEYCVGFREDVDLIAIIWPTAESFVVFEGLFFELPKQNLQK